MTTNIRYDTIYQIKNILRDTAILQELYGDQKKEFSDFLLSVLRDDRFHLDARIEVAGDELYKIVNRQIENDNTNLLIEDKHALQTILLSCLKEKLNQITSYDPSINWVYLKNLDEIKPQTRQIVITKEANLMMKELILSAPYEYFKKYLLREHPEPTFEGQFYHLDPFVVYYFEGDWAAIKSVLNSSEVKLKFQKSEEEEKFYNFLHKVINIAQQKENEKFLIEDKKEIELAREFIFFIQERRKKVNNLTKFFN